MTANARSRASAFGVTSRKRSPVDESGAFRIEDPQAEPAPAAAEISGPTVALALDWIDELEPSAVSLLPDAPAVSQRSSQAPRATEARAALEVDELVFSLEAPAVASSLEPEPDTRFSLRRAAVIAFAMLLAAAVGGLTQWAIMSHEASSRPAHVAPVAAPRAVAR